MDCAWNKPAGVGVGEDAMAGLGAGVMRSVEVNTAVVGNPVRSFLRSGE